MMSGTTTTPRAGLSLDAISTDVPEGRLVRTSVVLPHLRGDEFRHVGVIDHAAASVEPFRDRSVQLGALLVGQDAVVGVRAQQVDVLAGAV